jgi:DNA end-binding protein Ku
VAAQHPIWTGQLRLALVSCPVSLFSTHRDRGSLHFNLINPKTGNRIRMVAQDAETEAEVSRSELVKGYEFKKNTYLILTDEDFESARIDSSSTIRIDKFVDAASIDPIWFDASYYLAPDGDSGRDVYAVLREAIASSGKMALARVVIARRERAIGILPMGRGLVAHTLHEERDLNDADAVFGDLPGGTPDPEMVQLARQLIARQTGTYDPADVEDRYEARLRAIVDAKLKGEGLASEDEPEASERNVVDLMTALKRSLGQAGDEKPRPKEKKSPAKRSAKRAG